MNSTSRGSRFVRIAARSPALASTGPEVIRNPTPSSRAMICASVVLPSPGGPWNSVWSIASPRIRALSMNTRRFARASACPMNSSSTCGRRARSASSGRDRGAGVGVGHGIAWSRAGTIPERTAQRKAPQRHPHGPACPAPSPARRKLACSVAGRHRPQRRDPVRGGRMGREQLVIGMGMQRIDDEHMRRRRVPLRRVVVDPPRHLRQSSPSAEAASPARRRSRRRSGRLHTRARG